MFSYRAILDVPRELVLYLARLLRAERRRRGTRKGARVLSCWQQAMFVLVWFRKQENIALLGAGFGRSRATAYRYQGEGVDVLAAQAPDLTEALQRVKDDGWAFVILDGTLVPSDRDHAPKTSTKGQVIDAWYAGKAHHHGKPASRDPPRRPAGLALRRPPRIRPRPDRRPRQLPRRPLRRRSSRPAHPRRRGYTGAGIGSTSRSSNPAAPSCWTSTTAPTTPLLRGLRAQGERAFALLKTRWAVLRHVTACPHKIGDIGKAALVLTHLEHKYIPC